MSASIRYILFTFLGIAACAQPLKIQQIDIFHTSHTDVGYTDQPLITRELQKRFLDIAIDACRNTAGQPPEKRFYWTAEATLTIDDWWNSATPERRHEFLEAVRSGQMEVTALPCNNTPFFNDDEWAAAVRWLPDDLWRRLAPRAAMQDDANGFPRAGAMKLLDRGIRYFVMGSNDDSGGAPFPRPIAFWWKMPDGRKLFVYLSEHYGSGYWYFETGEWRMGTSPRASSGFSRPPRPGEILSSEEASVRKAHQRCLERIRKIEEGGYAWPRLIVSITNMWRYDNDPPFPAITDFIATWNRLGLKPALRFTTASAAVSELEKLVGDKVPTYEGEWTDWWANGSASAPRELAGSRLAKRYLKAAQSPVWGGLAASSQKTIDEILRDLILFDEHTWGSNDSISLPDSLDTLAQFGEKSMLAWRAMTRAEFLLAQRMHSRLDREPEGLYITNTSAVPYSGWVRFPKTAPRRALQSLEEAATGRPVAVEWEAGTDKLLESQRPAPPAEYSGEPNVARVWIDNLPAATTLALRFSERATAPAGPKEAPSISVDADGWPVSIQWEGMTKPLFLAGTGDFLAVKANASRSVVARLAAGAGSAAEREETRRKVLEEILASGAGVARKDENAHTFVFTQALKHPRLKHATRRLEVWKAEPHARLTLEIYRISSVEPESFYVNFVLPAEGTLPVVSSGGVPFVPYREQLGATCRDYLAVDGWAHYRTAGGDWLWTSRDAAMVTIGGPSTLARRMEEPATPNRLMAMIFNNHWHTNFVADSHGGMEFRFDIVWKPKIEHAAELAEGLMAEPAVLVNPGARQDPLVLKHLYRP